MNRILVIRGGAIGDFILTLPALKAIREAFPNAQVEILGYKHIAVLAENRFYADAVQSIEYGALSGFFARGGSLDSGLTDYFSSFDVVISYLFDPDGIFEANLRRARLLKIVGGPAKIQNGVHATRQLARPIRELGIPITDFVPKVFPSSEDREYADKFLEGHQPTADSATAPLVALHLGSGSAQKNWPLENWLDLGNCLTAEGRSMLVVSGEADQAQLGVVQKEWRDRKVRYATNLPLPHLAALLAGSVFIGHDSGISHLAAAAGARCVLLFGPTDPEVWAPPGDNVNIIRATNGDLGQLEVETVRDALAKWERPRPQRFA